MIGRPEFEEYCANLPATTHVVQWGGASVFKVGGKIFAIYSNWDSADQDTISFKASEESFAVMPGQPGITPAKYLARAKWLSINEKAGFDAETVALYLANAHALVVAKLTRQQRKELDLS
jgi:predicted DNA-binding protein (MmcQ/YjbR family)